MPAYLIANLDITNPDGFGEYHEVVGRTLQAHGAEVLVSDQDGEVLEGQPRKLTVVLKFQSKAAAKGWYESEEYVKVKHLRTDNAEGIAALTDEFQMPG